MTASNRVVHPFSRPWYCRNAVHTAREGHDNGWLIRARGLYGYEGAILVTGLTRPVAEHIVRVHNQWLGGTESDSAPQ